MYCVEAVSPDTKDAIRTRRYWKPVFTRYLKDDVVGQRINRKIGGDRAIFDVTGTLYRKYYLMVKEQKEQLERNLRDASNKKSSIPLPPTRHIQSTTVSAKTLMISWQNQVGERLLVMIAIFVSIDVIF